MRSQTPSHQTLFAGLTGNELLDSLRVHFRPATVTSSYTEVRDDFKGDVTRAIADFQDGKPNPFVVDTTLIRRAYFEDYEAWDPSDMELDDPDAFLVEYTFAGTVSCDEENPWPLVPEGRTDPHAQDDPGQMSGLKSSANLVL